VGLRPNIDVFADDSHDLPLFWTYFPSPHASVTNAMAQVWRLQQLLHIKPPWGMIPRILAKLRDAKARAVIVSPRWQSAWWWPTLASLEACKKLEMANWHHPRGDSAVFLMDGTQVGGTTKNTKSICMREPRRTSHPKGENGRIRNSLEAQ